MDNISSGDRWRNGCGDHRNRSCGGRSILRASKVSGVRISQDNGSQGKGGRVLSASARMFHNVAEVRFVPEGLLQGELSENIDSLVGDNRHQVRGLREGGRIIGAEAMGQTSSDA